MNKRPLSNPLLSLSLLLPLILSLAPSQALAAEKTTDVRLLLGGFVLEDPGADDVGLAGGVDIKLNRDLSLLVIGMYRDGDGTDPQRVGPPCYRVTCPGCPGGDSFGGMILFGFKPWASRSRPKHNYSDPSIHTKVSPENGAEE